jgi:hypothetical protein
MELQLSFSVPRIKHGNKQTLETLINEEALLLAMYLRNERQTWVPRIADLRSGTMTRAKKLCYLQSFQEMNAKLAPRVGSIL